MTLSPRRPIRWSQVVRVRPLPDLNQPHLILDIARPKRLAREGNVRQVRDGTKNVREGMVMAGPSDPTDTIGTLPQTVRRDFSAVGYGEATRRAREVVPILRERAKA